VWSYTSTPKYAFMAWCSVEEKPRAEFTLTLKEFYCKSRTRKILLMYFLLRMVWKKRRWFIAIVFQLCLGLFNQENPRKLGRTEFEWKISATSLCWQYYNGRKHKYHKGKQRGSVRG
jgi:hypothetical protein